MGELLLKNPFYLLLYLVDCYLVLLLLQLVFLFARKVMTNTNKSLMKELVLLILILLMKKNKVDKIPSCVLVLLVKISKYSLKQFSFISLFFKFVNPRTNHKIKIILNKK